jgi:predicted TIM-barrel fold metal-dependent hydrolase
MICLDLGYMEQVPVRSGEAKEMLMSDLLSTIHVIDTDTHVVEPPDLWTSRVPAALRDRVPHTRYLPETKEEAWFIGDQRLSDGTAGGPAMAGWPEFPPDRPRTWDQVDPACWDPKLRLAKMDEYGIYAAVLYPNLTLFGANRMMGMADVEAQLAGIRAYNDYLTDWTDVSDRYIAISSLPFWDLQESLAEMERCAKVGHRGVTFSQDPTAFGLPALADEHWDPLWASAQEKGLTVNFHIGSAIAGSVHKEMNNGGFGLHGNYAAASIGNFMGNLRTITQVIVGGMCHRFPNLNFVTVESGVGWIPFALAALDWQWQNCGVAVEHPEYDLLPSEYFRRQMYGNFWFEKEPALFAIEQYPDNILYETDFPHPTSMSPGPASVAIKPSDYIKETLGGLPEATLRKVLHGNAARIYHLD